MVFKLIMDLFAKEKCASCNETLDELGWVPGYIKSTYFTCKNEACQDHHMIVHYKNGHYYGKLMAKFISRKGKLVTFENLKTKEIRKQQYV